MLDAVPAAPPPSCPGGGKWEAVHGDMAGGYEVRVQGDGKNHRLLARLERDTADLGGSGAVCVGGLTKPGPRAADPRDYRKIKRGAAEFAPEDRARVAGR
jgi:hypothetical protein